MGIEIDITADFARILSDLENVKTDIAMNAARRAINRTLLTLRKTSIMEITGKYKIKASSLREKYIKMNKAKGGSLGSLSGSLVFSGRPIPMIEFVKGSKEVIQQRGIKVKRRRKLRVEIAPGKKFILQGAFIQRAKSKQVFRRTKSGGFRKQSVQSIAHLIVNRGIGEKLALIAQERFRVLFEADVRARIEKKFNQR